LNNPPYHLHKYICKTVSDIEGIIDVSQDTAWVTKNEDKASEFFNDAGNLQLIHRDGEKYAGSFEGWETFYNVDGYVLSKEEVVEIRKQCEGLR
jgi:hypothetical protein